MAQTLAVSLVARAVAFAAGVSPAIRLKGSPRAPPLPGPQRSVQQTQSSAVCELASNPASAHTSGRLRPRFGRYVHGSNFKFHAVTIIRRCFRGSFGLDVGLLEVIRGLHFSHQVKRLLS